LITGIMHL